LLHFDLDEVERRVDLTSRFLGVGRRRRCPDPGEQHIVRLDAGVLPRRAFRDFFYNDAMNPQLILGGGGAAADTS
jgi:hypothetical protein